MFSRRGAAKRDATQRLNERSLKASPNELPEAVEAEIEDRLVKLKRASAQLTAAAEAPAEPPPAAEPAQEPSKSTDPPPPPPPKDPFKAPEPRRKRSASKIEGEVPQLVRDLQARVQGPLMDRVELDKASTLARDELTAQIGDLVRELLEEFKVQLNLTEHEQLVQVLLDEMVGLGPLEPLLADEAITDIMVNGPAQIYIERNGKLELTDTRFRDNSHVLNIAQRIVSKVGRRIDETSPLVDARLEDGSRVNIIIPPLAVDGASISIRKFAKQTITLDKMAEQANVSPSMVTVLKVAARCGLNILISGGTGSGKTTLLNALSQMIDHGERLVTIEDAAELQLQQPHVVRLETRPANLEGKGEINMRDLVKNALRMRPDRIILGEVRGIEAVDMLQAMNTGHDGSLGTIHANRPREALTRLENMVAMAGLNLPPNAVRTQIASALDMVIQVERMRDGKRRITQLMELVGMDGDIVLTQEIFKFQIDGEDSEGNIIGQFRYTGVPPQFRERARYYGLEQTLIGALV